MSFKAGDVVRPISEDIHAVSRGTLYIVLEITNGGSVQVLHLKNDIGKVDFYYSKNFEVVYSSPVEKRKGFTFPSTCEVTETLGELWPTWPVGMVFSLSYDDDHDDFKDPSLNENIKISDSHFVDGFPDNAIHDCKVFSETHVRDYIHDGLFSKVSEDLAEEAERMIESINQRMMELAGVVFPVAPTEQKCTCDFFTTILPIGCQCGGT